MFVCGIWSPVRAVCPNHDVVGLQTHTGNVQHLGSVTCIRPFILALSPHLFQPFFWIALFPSSILPTPHQWPFGVVSTVSFAPAPHLLSWRKTPSTWTLSTPSTCQPPPLNSAARAACLRLPPCPACDPPPFYYPWPALRYLSSPGGVHPLRVPPRLYSPDSSSWYI